MIFAASIAVLMAALAIWVAGRGDRRMLFGALLATMDKIDEQDTEIARLKLKQVELEYINNALNTQFRLILDIISKSNIKDATNGITLEIVNTKTKDEKPN